MFSVFLYYVFLMEKKHHIKETNKRRGDDWRISRQWALEDFPDVIHGSELREAMSVLLDGGRDDSTFAAVIDASPDNKFLFTIIEHRNETVAGRPDWQGIPIGLLNDRWSLHFDETAEEYDQAKKQRTPQCHTIDESVGDVERHYDRLIIPHGDELLIASAPFDPPQQ